MNAHTDHSMMPVPEWTPTHTLSRQIARARKEMGPDRWAALNAEFVAEQPKGDDA